MCSKLKFTSLYTQSPTQKIALNSFTLFVQQAQVATEEIKKRVMETIFDLLMVYESDFFKAVKRTL